MVTPWSEDWFNREVSEHVKIPPEYLTEDGRIRPDMLQFLQNISEAIAEAAYQKGYRNGRFPKSPKMAKSPLGFTYFVNSGKVADRFREAARVSGYSVAER